MQYFFFFGIYFWLCILVAAYAFRRWRSKEAWFWIAMLASPLLAFLTLLAIGNGPVIEDEVA